MARQQFKEAPIEVRETGRFKGARKKKGGLERADIFLTRKGARGPEEIGGVQQQAEPTPISRGIQMPPIDVEGEFKKKKGMESVVKGIQDIQRIQAGTPGQQPTQDIIAGGPQREVLQSDVINISGVFKEPTQFKTPAGVEDRMQDVVSDLFEQTQIPDEPARQPAGEGDGTMSDVLTAALLQAVPTIIGEVLGGKGGGEVGAKAGQVGVGTFLKGKQDTLEHQRELEIKAAKATAAGGARRFQQVKYEDQEGNIRLGKFDRSTGDFQLDDADARAGFAKGFRVDPETGEIISTGKAGGELRAPKRDAAVAVPTRKKFTIKEEKDVKDLRNKLLGDKPFAESRKAVSSADRAISLLSTQNPVADQGIQVIFPRMFGEVGNLAAQEQARFSGSPEILQKLATLKSKWTAGTIDEADRQSLLEVASAMKAFDMRRMRNTVEGFLQSEKAATGIDAADVLEPFITKGVEAPPVVREARAGARKARVQIEKQQQPEKVRQGNDIFKLDKETGEYKFLRSVK